MSTSEELALQLRRRQDQYFVTFGERARHLYRVFFWDRRYGLAENQSKEMTLTPVSKNLIESLVFGMSSCEVRSTGYEANKFMYYIIQRF